jgi:hypothetical protein
VRWRLESATFSSCYQGTCLFKPPRACLTFKGAFNKSSCIRGVLPLAEILKGQRNVRGGGGGGGEGGGGGGGKEEEEEFIHDKLN